MEDEIQKLIKEIAEDTSSGASELSFKAAEAIEKLASKSAGLKAEPFSQSLKEALDSLVAAQPDMAPLYTLRKEVLKGAKVCLEKSADSHDIRETVAAVAGNFKKKQEMAKDKIASLAFGIVQDGSTLLTHSLSSTVKHTLAALHNAGVNFHLVATESRPGLEGRELVKDLGRIGIPCTLIVDSAACLFLSQCTHVIVGADRVTPKYVVNKIGTFALALGAMHFKRKFFVLCDTAKCLPESEMSLNTKSQNIEEVFKEKHPNVEVANPYFEKTPLSLVTGVLTETGLNTPEEIAKKIKEDPLWSPL